MMRTRAVSWRASGDRGGIVTGLSFQTRELSGKWVQLLKEVLPRMARVAILWDAGGPDTQARAAQAATRSLQLSAQTLEVRGPADFEVAWPCVAAGRV